MSNPPAPNIDHKTVAGFADEWNSYSQEALSPTEHRKLFDAYFSLFPFDELPFGAEGFDIGCGTGRWAIVVAERVGHLHCIDPASKALAVAKRRMADRKNVSFHEVSVDGLPFADCSQDFGYALGVLHHIPDVKAAMASCVRKLKIGAPFLVYIYYALENRPPWFRALWRATDMGRHIISRLPFPARRLLTTVIAAAVYLPLARVARAFERAGVQVERLPLSSYRESSFYTMRTDALDRFGTRLEQRFTRHQIEQMMRDCGLEEIRFRDNPPYWVACGRRRSPLLQ